MAVTGNGELGFDSGEGAWETAPIAYIKVVAVKKLVVGFLVGAAGRARKGHVL